MSNRNDWHGRLARRQRGATVLRRFFVVLFAAFAAVTSTARADQAGLAYAYVLNDSHAADTFYSFDATKPFGRPEPVRPFGEFLLQRDGTFGSAGLPQTLNDNYGLLSGGLQFESRSGLRLFAQVGSTFAFGPHSPVGWSLGHDDFRAGASLYRDWNGPLAAAGRPIGSLFLGATYFSRYKNGIGYASVERGREFGKDDHPFQVYSRVAIAQDTRGFFYNNMASLAVGVRLLPLGHLGPVASLEETYNSFLGPLHPVTAAGYERFFFALRPSLSMGVRF